MSEIQSVAGNHFQRQQLLLRMEYEYEKEEFKRQTEEAGIQRKVARGLCWYPVTVGRNYYNSVNQFVVEIFRPEDTEVEHAFEYGRQVCFFTEGFDGRVRFKNFTASVSYVEGNRMVVALPGAHCLQEISGERSLGVQLYFDETSYRAMFEALEDVIRAKGTRLAELREVLCGPVAAGFRQMFPVRFPWLNSSQDSAVNKVLSCRDVAIVHGPPGTGKTTTLVEAVYETLHRETQVLVCAQSNTAVDWISEKLVDRGVPVLRIGNPTRVNDKMLSFTYERQFEGHALYPELWGVRKAMRELTSTMRRHGRDEREAVRNRMRHLRARAVELELTINNELFESARVVASTLVGSNHRLLGGRRFSTLFIDEAGQALEAAAWIAIRKADRVVLAGDHCQLPPTVKCVEAMRGGLGRTLMEHVIETKPIIGTPKAIDPEDYDGTSFTARWDAVGNADKYVLRVYSYINGGMRDAEVVPFLTESNLTETSYKVTGLSDSVIYYFTVQAMNNEGDISSESNEVQILPVVKAPKALAATHIQTNSFVAHWEKVPLANYYEATMYCEYTALNDEKHIVQETDMEYIVSDGTMDSPEYSSSSYVFPRNSGAFNWVVSSPVFIAGAVGLDNSLAVLSMPAYMYSPAFNLSPFGGKASFDIKLASKNTTTAVVALAVINKNKEFEEVESFEVPVTAQMTSHHIEFTKGTDEVYILIYPKDGVYLFFDEFSLAVDMPKGTSVEVPIDAMMVEDGTACRFEEVVRQSNERISYDVVAASISAEAQILSEPSNRVYVDIQSSVESNAVAEAKAWVSGNELVIDNPNAETVEVYDLCGVLHFMSDKGDSHLEVALDSPGVYVVKVGRQVIKVMR